MGSRKIGTFWDRIGWLILSVALAGTLLTGVDARKSTEEMTEEELYQYIFDDVDADLIILNDRICDVYLRCFYDTGPCTHLASAIKSRMSEVFNTVCGRCTDKQKCLWRHILDIFIPRRPKDWDKLLEIYAPEGWPKIKKFMDDNPPKKMEEC